MENSEIFCNFVADNQQFNKILLAMITNDKVIEIFFIIDEFCKEFEQEMERVYNSPLIHALQDEENELYVQSPAYLYELMNGYFATN